MNWIVVVQEGGGKVTKLYPARDKRHAIAIAKKRLQDDGRYSADSGDVADIRDGQEVMSWDGTTVRIITTSDPKELDKNP